jgi:membrane protease YdiL (CAAX protease family)
LKTSVLFDFAERARATEPLTFGLFLGAITLLPAFSEELALRGFILSGLWSRWGPSGAVVLSALLFGVLHLDVLQGALAVLAGLYLGYLRVRAGSLYVPIAAHALTNFVSTLQANHPTYNQPVVWTEGYPWGWVAAAGTLAVLGFVAFHRLTVPGRAPS